MSTSEYKNDQHLLTAIQQGDRQAYQHLVKKYIHQIMGFAVNMLGNKTEAEDVTQTIFTKVWEQSYQWQPHAAFKTWLFKIAYNQCIDVLRAQKRIVHELPIATLTDPSPEIELIHNEQSEQMRRLIFTLPEMQRAAIILMYYEALSAQMGAEILNITPKAFEMLLYRARAHLKQILIREGAHYERS